MRTCVPVDQGAFVGTPFYAAAETRLSEYRLSLITAVDNGIQSSCTNKTSNQLPVNRIMKGFVGLCPLYHETVTKNEPFNLLSQT